MPAFAYQVRDKQGKKVKGVIDGNSEKGVAELLAQQGYLITHIEPAAVSMVKLNRAIFRPKISNDDLIMFYFQLANIVEVGIPLVKAIETVSDQLQNRSFQKILRNLSSRITGGESLSEAMSHHQSVFPFLYLSMIQVGETSGNLAGSLRYVAELNEARDELRHQIHSALAYPMVLIVASIAVIIFMMVWIVPTFTVIFNQAGISLPLPTRLVYGLSLWIKAYPVVIFGFIFALGIGSYFLLRLPKIKYHWDRFWLSFPYIGLLIRRIEVSRWSRSMMLLLSSGVPILQTLEICKGLTQNLIFQDVLEATYVHVQGGGKLADTLQRSKVFPGDVVQMVSTGENSGTLDKMLFKIAEFYDQLIRRTLKKVTGMIEPVFILFLGSIIGLIMLAVLLPMFDMIKIFSPR